MLQFQDIAHLIVSIVLGIPLYPCAISFMGHLPGSVGEIIRYIKIISAFLFASLCFDEAIERIVGKDLIRTHYRIVEEQDLLCCIADTGNIARWVIDIIQVLQHIVGAEFHRKQAAQAIRKGIVGIRGLGTIAIPDRLSLSFSIMYDVLYIGRSVKLYLLQGTTACKNVMMFMPAGIGGLSGSAHCIILYGGGKYFGT
ncbi:hypothetical protein D3C72_1470830 [compost metagenome]